MSYIKMTEAEWAERKAFSKDQRNKRRLETQLADKERKFQQAIIGFKGEYKRIPENETYIALDDGRIWTTRSNKFLATANHVLGYLFIGKFIINGKKRFRLLHKMIAITFLDNPNGYSEINHKDGNKHNNHVSNLEWNTRKQNTRHAWSIGLMENTRAANKKTRGELSGKSKLTNEEVLQIRELRANLGFTYKHLAGIYNVGPHCISAIVNRKTWTHI